MNLICNKPINCIGDFCPHCGGKLDIINRLSEHYICDICNYEYNADGIINNSEMEGM